MDDLVAGEQRRHHGRDDHRATPSASASATGCRRYPDAQAIPADAHANVGIVVLAEPPYAEGKGDSASLAVTVGDLLDHASGRRSIVWSSSSCPDGP